MPHVSALHGLPLSGKMASFQNKGAGRLQRKVRKPASQRQPTWALGGGDGRDPASGPGGAQVSAGCGHQPLWPVGQREGDLSTSDVGRQGQPQGHSATLQGGRVPLALDSPTGRRTAENLFSEPAMRPQLEGFWRCMSSPPAQVCCFLSVVWRSPEACELWETEGEAGRTGDHCQSLQG